MKALTYTKKRLESFLSTIDQVKQFDFPYKDSIHALETIEAILKEHRQTLDKLTTTTPKATKDAACVACTRDLAQNLPLIGFIVRSTNVRNAFEVYSPLFRIARQVLGPKTRLVLSSEWNYSPFILTYTTDFPNTVFIGFPATESSNPLLLPLAGHELGHAIWANLVDSTVFFDALENAIPNAILAQPNKYKEHFGDFETNAISSDLVHRANWIIARDWAFTHVQETFCDFIGLRIFGVAYLNSFSYLLSPFPEPVSENHPSLSKRAADLRTAATEFGFDCPDDFVTGFPKAKDAPTSRQKYLLDLAEKAASSLVAQLISEADLIIKDHNVPTPSEHALEDIYAHYKDYIAPACKGGSLVDIVNAAWLAYNDKDLWSHESIDPSEWPRILGDIVLKNIEVFEVEQLLSGNKT
jgi:hypothetical protein